MNSEKTMVSMRLDGELVDELKILAKDENRAFSNLVETILKQYAQSKQVKLAVLMRKNSDFDRLLDEQFEAIMPEIDLTQKSV